VFVIDRRRRCAHVRCDRIGCQCCSSGSAITIVGYELKWDDIELRGERISCRSCV
jgi:hypothetical protein